MKIQETDRDQIKKLLERDPWLNIYALGDLDILYRPYVEWYRGGDALVCIFRGGEIPTLMALEASLSADMPKLLHDLMEQLPDYFYAHLSTGLERCFHGSFDIESSEGDYKMALRGMNLLESIDTGSAVPLDHEAIPELLELYRDGYPGNWFDPDMLDLNRYFGIRQGGKLVAAAGTHVYSREYAAAALGNIVVLPSYRGRGLGSQVSAALSRLLVSEGIRVGLNVHQQNGSAIRCYRKIGFEICNEYGEFAFRKKSL